MTATVKSATTWLRTTYAAGESWMLDSRKASYGTAVLRIGFGLILVVQLVAGWGDRSLAWGAGRSFAQGRVDVDELPAFLDLFFNGSVPAWAFDLQYLALVALSVLLVLGWRSRIVIPVLLVLYIALFRTNPFIGDGGIQLMRIVLVYMLFADTSGRWSLDARRRRAARASGTPSRFASWAWLGTLLHNGAVLLIAFQIFVVYVASAMYKIQGGMWQHGTAIYYVFQLDEFSTWPQVTEVIGRSGVLVAILSYSAVFVQLFFPFLLLRRPTRILALVAITGMHLGIGVLMGLMYFSMTMIAIDAIFVRDVTYEGVQRRLAPVLRRTWDRIRRRPAALSPDGVEADLDGAGAPRADEALVPAGVSAGPGPVEGSAGADGPGPSTTAPSTADR
ncbi:HTTM domain-containing protein [Oerskovia sp. NPDC060287]|uniref:HTTM domain-containing protein n=1 Tax=Oerskovia sp. NPDC060287 TaxID=3347095 RepID=UPI00365F201B